MNHWVMGVFVEGFGVDVEAEGAAPAATGKYIDARLVASKVSWLVKASV